MSNANLSDFLTDPLSEVTRKERRNLLLASTAGVLVAKMGLIPARISVLGVEFSPPAQQAFISLMSLIVGYFYWHLCSTAWLTSLSGVRSTKTIL